MKRYIINLIETMQTKSKNRTERISEIDNYIRSNFIYATYELNEANDDFTKNRYEYTSNIITRLNNLQTMVSFLINDLSVVDELSKIKTL